MSKLKHPGQREETYDAVGNLIKKMQRQKDAPSLVPKDLRTFMFKYAKTMDPHWEAKGSAPTANHLPAPVYHDPHTGEEKRHYLDILCDVWDNERLILVAKSRQMLISWFACIAHLHLAMSRESQMIFFASKKEDDAGLKNPLSLLSRSLFVHKYLPDDMKLACPVEIGKQPPILHFPSTNSTIQGVSQDAEALRMYTASSILVDEWAFQEYADQSYAALKPTIQGNGRIMGVSTPNGKQNLFYRLVHDKSALDEL